MTAAAPVSVAGTLRCPACGQFTGVAPMLMQTCAYCDFSFLGLQRPALPAPSPTIPATAIFAEARCFFHEANVAAAICGGCGRFMCTLCDLNLDGSHRCPACFELAQRSHTLPSLRQHDILFDSMALVAGWAWIVVYFSWIFAFPAVAYWAIAKWNAPRDYLIPRRRWRYAAAFIGLLWLPIGLLILFLIPR